MHNFLILKWHYLTGWHKVRRPDTLYRQTLGNRPSITTFPIWLNPRRLKHSGRLITESMSGLSTFKMRFWTMRTRPFEKVLYIQILLDNSCWAQRIHAKFQGNPGPKLGCSCCLQGQKRSLIPQMGPGNPGRINQDSVCERIRGGILTMHGPRSN